METATIAPQAPNGITFTPSSDTVTIPELSPYTFTATATDSAAPKTTAVRQ